MATFVYEPAEAKAWSDSVVKLLDGDGQSVNGCAKDFNTQIEKLVQPGVWTGAAAKANFEDFMSTHELLKKFTDQFGQVFTESMAALNKDVGNVEKSNLGSNTNVDSFGTTNYSQIQALSNQNIDATYVTYDYATISEISTQLNTIRTTLDGVNTDLKNTINKIGGGSQIWDGNRANGTREALINVLDSNMPSIFENLDRCIKNIKTAAENAQSLDAFNG